MATTDLSPGLSKDCKQNKFLSSIQLLNCSKKIHQRLIDLTQSDKSDLIYPYLTAKLPVI